MPLRSLPLRQSLLSILGLFVLAVIATARPAQADFRESAGGYCCPNYQEAIRPGDEVYLISTRCLPSGCGFELPVERMSVQRYDGGLGWVESSLEEAVAGDAFDCTSVFVHGNWMDTWWTKRRGWATYHELTRDWEPERHIRYVIWSWPTQKDAKSLASIRRNAERADSDAYYLAWFLSQLPADEQVSISAFSLGARVVSGALQLQAGGMVNGRVLENRTTIDYRVVFFAAATSSGAFSPYCRNGDGLSRVEKLVNYYNSADPVLKRYWLVAGRGNKAMGYAGAGGLSSEGWSKVQQYNTARSMGKEHDFNQYICNSCIMTQAREVLRFGDVTPTLEPVAEQVSTEELSL
ncbi:hypothetical protein M4951_18095 [Blastopirellula sp. J2-11]|uniref:hypothetical protein n=1 Tax=Blastopirellula sp. J2-11 TaxID=2943192 RepID=UPI0021C6D5F2|nr:hypothetical protein [Blastopirellula sp. J2-11]UUO05281.1 hypothetical protein M4951_18095 [Blastopirellula sp. J2-11]